MPYMLTNSDWRNINKTTYAINIEEDRSTFLFYVMKHLNLLCPYTCGIFNQVRISSNGIVIYNSSGVNLLPEDTESINKYGLTSSPFIRGVCMLPNGSVTCGLSRDQFTESQQLNFRNTVIPHDPNHTLTVVLYYESQLQGFILLMRRDEESPFSAADICAMDILRPHISLQFHKVMEATNNEINENWKKAIPESMIDRFHLTKREVEVLNLLHEHRSDEEICNDLFITKSTLKKHINHIYKKCRSKAERNCSK